MPGFSLTPVAPYPPSGNADFPLGIQWQQDGISLGDRGGVDTVNLRYGITATRGTGENANVLTIDATPFTWAEATDAYLVTAPDFGNGVIVTVASGGIVTVPGDDELGLVDAQGDVAVQFMQGGAGALSINGQSGVAVRVRSGLLALTAGRYAVVTLRHVGANEWVLHGDLAAG